ncbi:MAG: septum formation protein Maf [Planctomycetes bacterium]|nr:septum formation protein Maf [Planctomycetota bacterium]MBI3834901.1 septum formation protein Maf [Planctomycetota bacterium]
MEGAKQGGFLRFVLASGSPRRAQLLRDAGYLYDVMAAPHEEPSGFPPHMIPVKQTEFLSRFKAESVAKLAPGRLILAADTIAALGDRVFGKPFDRSDAERILRTMCGTTHDVITAVTLLDAATGSQKTIHDITRVTMRRISDFRLDDYLASEAWRGKAGAYGIQDHDDPFVEHIDGSFTNVMGLPMEKVQVLLTPYST